jgi:hypothetical protein
LPKPFDIMTAQASRKAEREAIARYFLEIAEKFGATIERRDSPRNVGYCGPSIHLGIRLNGVGASLSIDDLHGGEYGLISWHNAGPEYGRDYSIRFNTAVGEFTKLRPHHKATSGDCWGVLAARLQAGLRLASRNEAFTA